MPANEKREGHAVERNPKLHKEINKHFKTLVNFITRGGSETKVDYEATDSKTKKKIKFSNKFTASKSTQVLMTTQKQLSNHVPLLTKEMTKIKTWLGTIVNESIVKTSFTEIKNWSNVDRAMNLATKDGSLLRALFTGKVKNDEVQYLTWIDKKHGGIYIIDLKKYFKYIQSNATWQSTAKRGGGSIKLIDKNTNKTLVHLQRAGNGPITQKINPLFHVHKNWPDEVVVYSNTSFTI